MSWNFLGLRSPQICSRRCGGVPTRHPAGRGGPGRLKSVAFPSARPGRALFCPNGIITEGRASLSKHTRPPARPLAGINIKDRCFVCPIPLGALDVEPGSAAPFLSFNPHACPGLAQLCPCDSGTATHSRFCVPKSSAGLLKGSRRVKPGRARLSPTRAELNSLTRDMRRDPRVVFVTNSVKVALISEGS